MIFNLFSPFSLTWPHPNTNAHKPIHTRVRSSSIHGSIDEDRVMPLPRTKKTIVNSANMNAVAPANSSNTNANSSFNSMATMSSSSSASLSSASAAVNRNESMGPPPMPPPRRAASQQRLVGWLVGWLIVWFGWISCSFIVLCGLALCVLSGSFAPFVPSVLQNTLDYIARTNIFCPTNFRPHEQTHEGSLSMCLCASVCPMCVIN